MKRALFLDRDGVFNDLVFRDGILTAPWSWAELSVCPSMTREGLDEIKGLGFLLILVTNQPDVVRGKAERSFVDAVHAKYRADFGLDGIYACFHEEDSHPWKKPNPGMLLQAAQDFSLSLPDSFILGDTDKDMSAGRAAGVRGILWERPYNTEVAADWRVSSLKAVTQLLSSSLRADP